MADQNRDARDEKEEFDLQDKELQSVLTQLLAVYQPVLERDLKRSQSAKDLTKETLEAKEPCEDEIELANQLFGKFMNTEVAMAVLGAEGRQIAGPPDRWKWCVEHIRCCIIFGWLLCRGPRNFRAYVYYLRRYWICVRQTLGQPVSNPWTDDERQDFQTLVKALADAYRPYLSTELSSVDFPLGLPNELESGQIDCFEGSESAAAIFERMLTVDTASALLGKAAFAEHARDPFFRFCRCWCLCSIRFGCCLARARNLVDVLRCLGYYFRCVRSCFRPLMAEIDTPVMGTCATSGVVAACASFNGITITGNAAGGTFTHYTLSYRWGLGPWVNDAVVYPNCGRPPGQTSSNVAVGGGILGYLDRFLLPPGETTFDILLDVFGTGALHLTDTTSFKLKTLAVQVKEAAQVNAFVAADPFHLASSTKLIKAVNDINPAVPELSIGGSFTITGSAYVVGCDRLMTQYVLAHYAVSTAAPVPLFPDASGGVPIIPPVVYGDNPSHPWSSGCPPFPPTPNTILNGNLVAGWSTETCMIGPPSVPKVDGTTWSSGPLNGRYVLLVEARDRALPGGLYPGTVAAVDQVVVWIDNKETDGAIISIGGITGCGDLHLKDYVGTTAAVTGIAYDPPIDAATLQQEPNDNFGGYAMSFQKNGGAGGSIPALTPNLRVPNVWPGPPPPAPGGVLANWDIVAALDGGVGPVPTNPWQIIRGSRCAYVLFLTVWDKTHVGDSGGNHHITKSYAINVINDL